MTAAKPKSEYEWAISGLSVRNTETGALFCDAGACPKCEKPRQLRFLPGAENPDLLVHCMCYEKKCGCND